MGKFTKVINFSLLVLLLLQFAALDAAMAARQCRIILDESVNIQTARTAPKLNSVSYVEIFDLPAKVFNRDEQVIATSLRAALEQPAVAELIRTDVRKYQIHLKAKLPTSEGGGLLRLVVLNQLQRNLAYNHVELTALLKVNPELANAIGFYAVEGHPNLAWAPDVQTVNFRLKRLAKKFGFNDSVWSYAAADGVVGTIPFLELLAKGKFPFAGDSSSDNVNLSVHDSMHAVAFAVLNVTKGGREVLAAAKSRNHVFLEVIKRLRNEFGETYAQSFVSRYGELLGSDAMERTMLLTIVLTGNYDYFSAYDVLQKANPKHYSYQNRETTIERIKELLRLFNYSHRTYAQVLDQLAPAGDAKREILKQIFIEEAQNLSSASEATMLRAAKEIVNFMPDKIFRSNVRAGPTENSQTEDHTPAGPETIR